MKELQKTYNPSEIEDRIYRDWLQKNYFHADVNPNKKPFTIVMPPPNITGQLHMGHALDNTLQDILIRYKRMQGYEALWQPGTDHAAIATEVKVIDKLKKEGIDKHDLGREGFLKKAWEWREEYGSKIINQLHKLGSSADWERERFTLDEGCSNAVQETFIRLYKKGYIYKGNRIINWCPVCHTSISDAEVEHKDQDSFFWHINYPVVGESGRFLEIATTRPETMLGDTAIAVNPEDPRYKDLIGKFVHLPLTDRDIPIVADEHADMEFGTGCVKITPAHDPNDFEVGLRHNLPQINMLSDDARVSYGNCRYNGMDRYEARKAIVEDLKAEGLLVKIVPHTHAVGTHDRCGTTIEPMIKPQWFVKMDEMAKPAITAIEKGELKFVPESFTKTYLHWLYNIKDWCISRQLWWGHRIPAYYCEECGEIVVSAAAPDKCPKCGSAHLTQDEDTLDTWFSSALWPFSTLGWPADTPEYQYFYPTDVLVTGYDIIFFWVIRMVFSAYEQTGKSPFHTVLIHGLVRDSLGRKMSKSLGNGIDPIEVIDKYGADALRMTLITGNAPGNDMRFYWERVEASRNFANKVWNASRFIMMNLENGKQPGSPDMLQLSDKWILSRCNTVVREVTENIDKYELGIALSKIYDFIWDEFCDWYIEMVKPRLRNAEDASANSALWTLKTVLNKALKLLHPFMPFITEEIYRNLNEGADSIMISKWPEYDPSMAFENEAADVEKVKAAVKQIRNLRTNLNVPPSKKTSVHVVYSDPSVVDSFNSCKDFFMVLAGASDLILQSDKNGISADAVSAVIPDAALFIPLEELVDISKEIERLEKEEARLHAEIQRSSGMLSNEKFISKAPETKINEEKEKLAKYQQMLAQVSGQLVSLKGKNQ